MPNFAERLTFRDNLYWAWSKAKHLYRCGDIWFDEAEVAHFEANLELEIENIIRQFSALRYRMSPIRPVAHPKKSTEAGKFETRQAFSVAVRDQVAWIAFVNVVGPHIDSQMPAWSYGNRLFRSTWFEEGPAGQDLLKVGWYRHSSGELYRKFHQSWPVFRRHVYLTVREMAAARTKTALSEPDQRALDVEQQLPDRLRLPYLKRGYWERPIATVHWASVDLQKFYPNISTDLILHNLVKYSKFPPDEIRRLAKQLLTFPIDLKAWTRDELEQLNLKDKPRVFTAIPTGLFVSGFLANVALMETDQTINRRLNGRIAHFRYVDDHIILATGFDDLVKWLEWYQNALRTLPGKVQFNPDKAHPKELAHLLQFRAQGDSPSSSESAGKLETAARKATQLDPRFPAPLMTQTLGLVSDIARTDFDRLDDREQRHILDDLEHLLLTQFPDTELREDTRIAFAAAMISRLAPRSAPNIEPLARLQRRANAIDEKLRREHQAELSFQPGGEMSATASKEVDALLRQLKRLRHDIGRRQQEFDSVCERERERVFALLLKALHEHPEKLRLWTRLLDYCRRIGYSDLSGLGEEITLHAQNNPATAPYLRALVWQVMADHCIDCAKAICSDTASDEWILRSWNYLNASLRLFTAMRTDQPSRFYAEASARLFQCAAGAASLLISKSNELRLIPAKDVQVFHKECRKAGAIDWEADPETWAAKAGQTLSVWLWWAETKSSPKLATEPTAIWHCAAEKLDPRDDASWTVWARYPRHLTPGILKHLDHPTAHARHLYLSQSDNGWLYDVLLGLRLRRVALPGYLSAITSRVGKTMTVPATAIPLDDWAAWTAKRANTKPDDPRISEWTALKIVHRIASALSDVAILAGDFPIHPANFHLPSAWMEERVDLVTWESWRSTFALISTPILRRNFLIKDARFCRVLATDQRLEVQREPVRGLGLLLLGLLRRSFEWPAAWNPSGHQQAWAGIAKALTTGAACSSWTAAIIEACLVPRARETLLFPTLHDARATDTQFDPPQIDSISELKQTLEKAASVLAGYQLSVLNHEPRQLLPISLKQLTRPNWQEDFALPAID